VPGPPWLAGDLVTVQSLGATTVTILGGPGAVSTADATVSVTNLDSTAPAERVSVAADGSFEATIEAAVGNEVRIMAWHDHLASEPVDARLAADGFVSIDRSGLCWHVEPLTHVWFVDTTTASVSISNACDAELVLSRVAPRREPGAFSVADPPERIAAGAEAAFTVAYSPSGAPLDEEVLLIEAAAPEAARRPLTLVGEVAP
jgi:hypothetical protein